MGFVLIIVKWVLLYVMGFVGVNEVFQILFSVDGQCDFVKCASERIFESVGALDLEFEV